MNVGRHYTLDLSIIAWKQLFSSFFYFETNREIWSERPTGYEIWTERPSGCEIWSERLSVCEIWSERRCSLFRVYFKSRIQSKPFHNLT